ncbi:MAG TPA: DUF2780 domain-containing protein [Pseudomonas sp.]
MQALHTISLSALLLAASLPAFAVTAGDAVQATPVPAAPALQVAPATQTAPLAPAAPVTQTAPLAPAAPATQSAPLAPPAPATEAAAAAQTAPVLPATQAAPIAQPAAAAAPAPIAPALPAGAAALGGLVNPQTLALIDQLRALQVTPQQAMGGVGALLGLAQSQLAADQYAQLAGSVPGLEFLGGNAGSAASAGNGVSGVLGRLGALSGLLGGSASPAPQPSGAPTGTVSSLEEVNQAFSALGMGVGLVGQFAPILLQFLGNQGVAGTLLQSLGGIWGVPGGLAPVAPVAPASTPVAVGG